MTTTRRSVLAFLAAFWPAASVSAFRAVQAPNQPLTAYNAENMAGGFAWAIGDAVFLTTTYVSGEAGETLRGPNSNTVIAAAENPVLNPGFVTPIGMTVFASSDPVVTGIRIYLNINGAWRGYMQMPNVTNTYFRTTIGTAGTPQAASPPCFVCGSADLRDLALTVSGAMIDSEHYRTIVRRDLPVEQYCGNCGTKRVNRWAI